MSDYAVRAAELRSTGGVPHGMTSSVQATIGQRFAAYMIDTLIVMALYVIALGVVLSGIASSSGFVITVGFILYLVAGLVFPIYNYVIRVGRDGATIGKSMIGLSVVDVDTGGTIGAGRAFIRSLLTFLAFTALFMDRQRGIHDQAARSVVVTGNPTAVPGVVS